MISVKQRLGWLVRGISRRARKLAHTWHQLEHYNDPRYAESRISPTTVLNSAQLARNNIVGERCLFVGNVSIGYASTINDYCTLWAGEGADGIITVGNYCQLGPYVAIYAVNHPVSYITTYVNRRLLNAIMKERMVVSRVSIGHDVWIGHGSIILPGVTIGSGAIVGAGSVVTHDIPPYQIVAGNPARVLKPRFTTEIIDALLQLKWWELSFEELLNYRSLFDIDLQQDMAITLQELEKFLAKQQLMK